MELNVTGCDLSSPCGRDLIKAMKDVTVAPGPEEVPGWPLPPPPPQALSATKVVIVTAEALSQNRRFVFIMHLYYKLPGNGVFR